MAPEVRMRRPIRYKPKDPVTLKKPNAIKPVIRTLKAIPRPTMIPSTRATLKATLKARQARPTRSIRSIKKPSPNPFTHLNMNSANMLYDPKQPSPKIKINTDRVFQKLNELQAMLEVLKRKRVKNVSMNHSAKEYLNFASYEDPLLDNDLKLKGVKGTAFG